MTKEYASQALAESARMKKKYIATITAMLVAGIVVGAGLYPLTFRSLSPAESVFPIIVAAVGGAVLLTLATLAFRHSFKIVMGK